MSETTNDFCDKSLAAKETVGIFFVEILQPLKRRLARLGRQILKVFNFGITDNGGFDVDNRAAKISGEIVVISRRCAAFRARLFRGLRLFGHNLDESCRCEALLFFPGTARQGR